MSTKEQCWKECANDRVWLNKTEWRHKCVAISFHTGSLCPGCNKTCFMYRKLEYGVVEDTNYVTLTLDSENIRNKTLTVIHSGKQLVNHSKKFFKKTSDQCWGECIKNSSCVAISFCESCDGACYLFERGNMESLKIKNIIAWRSRMKVWGAKKWE